ncbi:hypothetical protein [Parasitella parasitica]|uniref:FAR1 domain-containing protein n=1 Tax=Parasitella parasitica TaxID=35722 RepID=A0A0B7NLQ3_9FUNG|nr:hypothetical protein [Parasitella parasitica]
MTKPEHDMLNDSKPNTYMRVPMEPLYERLLKKPFGDSVSAIEYCRSVCAEFGFTVKQEASANRNIYVYCSKPSPQRKRPSKRCDCRWRVVLSENEHEQWEFRKSMNPNASEHNHEMMSPEEMVKAWPAEVNEMIIQLARQRLQTHEIREAVKQQFPDISWNERRFYNRLTEERKRIRQRGVVERSQRILLLAAQLCSVVASNEEWAFAVDTELQRMFENFCQLARLTPENINTLVDLKPELIQMETDRLVSRTHRLSIASDNDEEMMGSPAKKRRSLATDTGLARSKSGTTAEPLKGIQMVYVPSYSIQVQTLQRSSSESTASRRFYAEAPYVDSSSHLHQQQQQQQQQHQQQQQQPFGSSSSFFSLASPTSSSSSSSSMPFQQQQRHTYNQQQRVTSPQKTMSSPTEFMMSQPYQTPQTQQPQPDGDYGLPVTTTAGPNSNNSIAYMHNYTDFSAPPENHFFGTNLMTPSRNADENNFFIKQEQSQVEDQQRLLHPASYTLPTIRSSGNQDGTNWT